MVDFNNDTTVTTPPTDVLKISILERRSLVINSIEAYTKLLVRSGGRREDFKHLISSLNSLFMEVRAAMAKEKIEVKAIQDKIHSMSLSEVPAEITEILNVFYQIDDFLYSKNLTKFDTTQKYDRFRTEMGNKKGGF
jgi:hypothetical protein